MKKKILLTLLLISLFACLLAISISAATQNYSTFDVVLTDGTQKTAYTSGIYQWEGRIYLNSKLYAEAPVDTEGAYVEIDWTTVKELDFSNAMLYMYDAKKEAYNEMAYGTNQGNTAMCIYPNGIDKAKQLTSLEKVTTGKAVVVRGSAFNGAPALKTLVISSSLKEIQWGAFTNCTALETIIFEGNSHLETVYDAFVSCTSLKSVSLPATVKTLGEKTFLNCTALESVSFAPGGNCTLKSSVFQNCSALKSIDLSDTVKVIGSNTFRNCDSIITFTVPDTVTAVEAYAFAECDNLESLIFSDASSVKNKLVGIIMSCPKIVSFKIPHLVTELGYDNFWNCTALTEIIWPDNLTAITGGNNWSACKSLKSISIPNSVTTMSAAQFSGCSNLEEIRLGASLTGISNGLLILTSLKRVYISGTVTSFGSNVLGYSNPADSSSNITFIFTGTKEQAEALRAMAVQKTEGTNHAPNTSKFYDAILVSASEYDASQEPSGFHFVYDYSECDAFYSSVHNMKGQQSAKVTSYFDVINIGDTCERCSNMVVTETINPLFVYKGYTVSTYGETYSMAQGFMIDNEAITRYMDYAPDFEFGLIAAGNLSGEPFAPALEGELCIPQTKLAHDYFDIKISGITSEIADAKIVFCAYVKANGNAYYLDNGASSQTVAGISYNQALELLNNK